MLETIVQKHSRCAQVSRPRTTAVRRSPDLALLSRYAQVPDLATLSTAGLRPPAVMLNRRRPFNSLAPSCVNGSAMVSDNAGPAGYVTKGADSMH